MVNQWQFAKYLYNLEGLVEIPPFVHGKLKSFNYTNEEGGGEGNCDLGMLQVTHGTTSDAEASMARGTPGDAGLSVRASVNSLSALPEHNEQVSNWS